MAPVPQNFIIHPSPPSVRRLAVFTPIPGKPLADHEEHLITSICSQFGYDEMQQLGFGKFGLVFRARNMKRDRLPTAVKIIFPEIDYYDNDEEVDIFWARVNREATCLRTLNHPNIIRLLHSPNLYVRCEMYKRCAGILRLEYADGPTLWEFIQERPYPNPRQFQRLMHQLACGLDHIHGLGWVHLDLKPANLIVIRGGDLLKIIDFGLAREYQEHEMAVAGTDRYRCPQMEAVSVLANVKGYDSKLADVYGAGVVAFEGRVGIRKVVDSRREMEGMADCARRLLGPNLSRQDELIIRLVAYNEADRPSANEFARLWLDVADKDEPVSC